MKSLLVLFSLLFAGPVVAQTMQVVMLSDLHFDPLRDPGKAARLAAAPVTQWKVILEGPPTTGHTIEFASEQARCGARGIDSDYPLILASMEQSRLRAPHAAFVTVNGDLLVHAFECRYEESMHTSKGYSAFAEKTTNFVVQTLAAEFKGVPVYIALGNNDSSCGDYSMDLHGGYFKATSDAVMQAARIPATSGKEARAAYEQGGYFAASPPGMPGTELLMIDDIFLSRRYSTCGGAKHDSAGTDDVLKWLTARLEQAKAHGIRVWVLGHIPPGIDAYGTLKKFHDVCTDKNPELFLQDSALGDLLSRFSGTVKLAVFGHTHSDEIRLVGQVPAKLVGSVTPINGNLPSITIAQVDGKSARLLDYQVYVAPEKTGAGSWEREYSFRETYQVEDFSAASLSRIIAGFRADSHANDPKSQAYIRGFYPGSTSPLGLVWGQDVCALSPAKP